MKPTSQLIYRGLDFTAEATALLARRLARLSRELRMFRAKVTYSGAEDDTFIVSYPKSGTTWVQMIVHQLMSHGSMEFSHIDAISPHYEETLVPIGKGMADLQPPRVVKTHLPYGSIPKGPGRYIYVLRDGRDVAVSYYYQQAWLKQVKFDEYFRKFVSGQVNYGSWFSHVSDWIVNKDRLNVFIVKYEDVVANLERGIKNIAAFCNIDTDEKTLAKILDHCRFESMRQHEAKFNLITRLTAVHKTAPLMIRRGHVGAWNEYIDEQMLELYKEAFQRHVCIEIPAEYKP